MPLRLDAHQHFWRYQPEEYHWMQPGWAIRRDFLPEHLGPILESSGFDGSIAVQARQSIVESRWLLELANQHPFIHGVVGWVDLRSDGVEEQLELLARHPRFVGVRHVVQDEPDPTFLLRSNFLRGIALLKQFQLTYDLLILPGQLPAAIELVRRFPQQSFVLDHGAKPLIRQQQLEPWSTHIAQLAASENVACKLSGLVTEAEWQRWEPSHFRPYIDRLLECFGPRRLLYGSDWPVCLLAAADYASTHQLVAASIAALSSAEQAAVLGGNAERIYLKRP